MARRAGTREPARGFRYEGRRSGRSEKEMWIEPTVPDCGQTLPVTVEQEERNALSVMSHRSAPPPTALTMSLTSE